MLPVKRALALGLITSAVFAAPASAGEIVFNTGDEIHVANDDGSNERVLLTKDDIPGATSVYDPFIQPNGDTLLFTARTPARGINSLYCGFRCAGVYKLDNTGTITRLSPPPIDCQDTVLCTGLDVDGRLTADGSRYFFNQVYAEPNTSGTFNSISRPFVAPAVAGGGADAVELKGRCAGPSSYTPSPVDSNDYVYVDCPDTIYGYTIRRGDTGKELVYEDGQIQQLSWRADGGALADVETGSDAGIWTLPLDGRAPTHSVGLAFNWENSASETHVTYVGDDKVAFSYDGAIRIASVDCQCWYLDSTKLLDVTDNKGLAWTAKSVPTPKAPEQPAPGGNPNPGGGTTNPGGGGTPGTGNAPGNGNSGGNGMPSPITVSLTPKTVKLGAALKGLTIPFKATGPGQLKLQATLDAKTAKKLKLIKKGTKAIAVATGSVTVTKAGSATLKLKFTKSYLKKLGKAKSLKLKLAGGFSPSGGSAQPVAGSLTLKR